jgi:peroxiredoxin Q/BCP
MTLTRNEAAPDFQLNDENGEPRKLSDFLGKPVVLYFYPKDDTPGCTAEACEFRDDYGAYESAGIVILGISPDSSKSHNKFKKKYNLPFTILADIDHAVCDRYGVWGEKSMFGKKYFGVLRTTFVIGQDGKIKEIFENVTPKGHSSQVLSALSKTD